MSSNNKMVTVFNKRSTAYTVSTPNGDYFEWLPAREGFEDSHEMTVRDVQWLHTRSATFKKGYLYIEDADLRKRLGLETEKVKSYSLSREDIEKMLKGNMNQLKKLNELKDNKNLILEVVEVAKELNITNSNKIDFLSEISGIPYELIRDEMKKDDDSE